MSSVVDDETGKFSSDPKLTFQHPYPPTKIMFVPDKEGAQPDLLATTGDYLRIWKVTEDGVVLNKLLNNVRSLPDPLGQSHKPPDKGGRGGGILAHMDGWEAGRAFWGMLLSSTAGARSRELSTRNLKFAPVQPAWKGFNPMKASQPDSWTSC